MNRERERERLDWKEGRNKQGSTLGTHNLTVNYYRFTIYDMCRRAKGEFGGKGTGLKSHGRRAMVRQTCQGDCHLHSSDNRRISKGMIRISANKLLIKETLFFVGRMVSFKARTWWMGSFVVASHLSASLHSLAGDGGVGSLVHQNAKPWI